MKAYYHARAPEYDDWWLGLGCYSGRDRPGWEEELDEVAAVLGALSPARTLDVACGTGFITRHLPGEVTGLDQSDAMLEIARKRVPHARFVQADGLALPFEDGAFERIFASYFYCHLEEDQRVRFLAEARRVAPRLVLMGSRRQKGEEPARGVERALSDGSRWTVYKRVFEPAELAAELGGEILHAERYFVVVAA